MKEEQTTDQKGQEFLRRQAEIVKQRDEFVRGDLKQGWGKNAIKDTENLPAFDPNLVSRGPNADVPRLQKPAILTVEQLRQEVDQVGSAVQDSLDQFEQDNASLDQFYQSQRDADELVRSLEAQLAEARQKADSIRSAGSPKQKLINAVARLELAVVGAAGAILQAKLQNAAQATFHCDYDVLPEETRQALRIQFETLRRYCTPYATRFGKQLSQGRGFTVEQVQARAHELLQELTNLDEKELA